MIKYCDYKHTAFGYHIRVDNQESWLVAPVSTNRDSDLLTESNWEVVNTHLEKNFTESKDYQIHRFRHWEHGYFEIILLNPECEELINYANDVENALADYPVLNEEHYSESQHTYCWEYIRSNFSKLTEDQACEVLARLPEVSENIDFITVERVVTELGYDALERYEYLSDELEAHNWQSLSLEINPNTVLNSNLVKINSLITAFLEDHAEVYPTIRDTEELTKLETRINYLATAGTPQQQVMEKCCNKQLNLL